MPALPRPLVAASLLLAVALAAAPAVADTGAALPWLGADRRPLPFADEAALLDFLRRAPVVERERLTSGLTRPWKLTLEDDGVRLRAIFRDVDEELVGPTRRSAASERASRDSYRYELAAFALDRLLGIGRVPPTVERAIGRSRGALQLWVEGAETEAGRIAARRQPDDRLAMTRQRQLMRFFDVLIHNTDRNHGNILVRPAPATGREELLFIDHTRAFQPAHRLLGERSELVMIDPEVLLRLRGLDAGALDDALGAYLDRVERDALERRRRQLLRWVDARVERFGSEAVLIAAGPGPAASSR